MGMPVIIPGKETRQQAVTDLIESVALQETALSHILNAEGEKMQVIIERRDVSVEQLIELNTSVHNLVNAVTRLEMLFQFKLELFADNSVPDTPPAVMTAEKELTKIDISFVIINVPLDSSTAQQVAVSQAIATAQAQISPGYTLIFTPKGYAPGELTGKFTITNKTDPTDMATDSADRKIEVLTTAAAK